MEEKAFRVKYPIEGLAQEDVSNWNNSPITRQLFKALEEYNGQSNHSVFVAIQYDEEKTGGIFHLYIS